MADRDSVTLARDPSGVLVIPISDDWDTEWVTLEKIGKTVVITPSSGPVQGGTSAEET